MPPSLLLTPRALLNAQRMQAARKQALCQLLQEQAQRAAAEEAVQQLEEDK